MKRLIHSLIFLTSLILIITAGYYIFIMIGLSIKSYNSLSVLNILFFLLILLIISFVFLKEPIDYNMTLIYNDWGNFRKNLFKLTFYFSILNLFLYITSIIWEEPFGRTKVELKTCLVLSVQIMAYILLLFTLLSSLKLPFLENINICCNKHLSALDSKYCYECGKTTELTTINLLDMKISILLLLNNLSQTKKQKCPNGHFVSIQSKYCNHCGEKI